MLREHSAGAVIYRVEGGDFKFLILKYGLGHWDFPKGNVEKGESELETVKREVLEETGIDKIEIIDGFKERVGYYYRMKGNLIYKTVNYYLARTDQKEVKLSYEHEDYAWVTVDEALKYIKHKNSIDVLNKAYQYLKNKGGETG
ncbi:NUDIX domain-containing protein [Candidatus Kryptonium thompsonii]|uniref:Bis(5'-nucleosyl)-tetraphosphatase [asymmetrical] n=1 Tax=Candidatus Kryptonium thompsonii TaxID=1633631 RepID=A0A0P1NVY2_9BACT|nr:NUDIX domain-containing protein [Candidatus Kryptonium thompsoni]CUS79089.1 NUDIX domain-containing protein [Candidatus Kryptonium thompsoni]CUS81009.1 NUDIX domain-containing protein [Candidatus Kryptonium thompsoni]CUS83728.1 NUDIX domain-containing protein [Candidatus Kryptonium thompsoni]CUS88460.1 NUDIX domain-containing protein [Candidatus Kryptonium thompsoni]CUS91985.1 NUDIX domain-containing protein [Candidatus Kryptonium thompsoni]